MKVSYQKALVFVALAIMTFLTMFFMNLRLKSNNLVVSSEANSSETTESELNKIRLKKSLASPLPMNNSLVKSSNSSSSQFDTAESLKSLQEQILRSGSFLSWVKRQQDFRASGCDTIQNFEGAKRLISEKYPDELDEESVTKRVLALEFLTYSYHLNKRDCLGLFSSLVSQFQRTTSKDLQRAIQFDVGSLAYSCTEVGGKAFSDMINALPVAVLKGQCLEAQISYKENKKNS